MLGFVTCLNPQIPSTSPNLYFTFKIYSFSPKPQFHIPKHISRFILFAQNGNKDDLTKQPSSKKPEQGKEDPKDQQNGSFNGGDSKNDRRSMFNFRLGDLLDPDPDNIVALGLTGLLTWASVQVLWQLFLISGAILLAALKYSFIAALLITPSLILNFSYYIVKTYSASPRAGSTALKRDIAVMDSNSMKEELNNPELKFAE